MSFCWRALAPRAVSASCSSVAKVACLSVQARAPRTGRRALGWGAVVVPRRRGSSPGQGADLLGGGGGLALGGGDGGGPLRADRGELGGEGVAVEAVLLGLGQRGDVEGLLGEIADEALALRALGPLLGEEPVAGLGDEVGA